MTFGNNWTATTIGSSSDRGDIIIGRRNQNTSTPLGSFSQNSGDFTGYVNAIQVGYYITGTGTTATTGTLNLSGAADVFLDTNTLIVGSGTGATGTLNLAEVDSGTLAIAGGVSNIVIGSTTSSVPSSGTVTLGDNWTSTTIGSSSNRADAQIGFRSSSGVTTGNFTQGGGTFTGYFNTLDVGRSTGGVTGNVLSGTLNVEGASSVLLDVTTLNVGVGQSAAGTVRLAEGSLHAVTAVVGGITGHGTQEGRLILNKTVYTVSTNTGTLLINIRGGLQATVGLSDLGVNEGGLVIENPAVSALTIDSLATSGRGARFTFENFNTSLWEVGHSGNFDALYFALKWEGVDRTTEINALATANKLGFDFTSIGAVAPTAFFQGGDTYYGYYLNQIPEPSSLVLAGIGFTGVCLRRRKRVR